LPDDLDYAAIRGLSNEARLKLTTARPATVGIASRLPGITPAAISLLLIHLRKLERRKAS
jgi:tRNA uridine 5-carboxymethylaminomethyl modification enzyme